MSLKQGRVSQEQAAAGSPVYDFAAELFETGFDAYDYAKCVWLGNPDPATRLAGEHPWPKREHDGETFVYSVPVHAGFCAVRGTALFVGKDPWRDVRDPRSWLVAEANLRTGEEHDHTILSSAIGGNRLWLQLAPANYSNIPKWNDKYSPDGWLETRAGTAYNPAPRDQIRIEGQLVDGRYLDHLELRNGLKKNYQFEDMVVLESMIKLVQQVKDAQDETDFMARRERALEYERTSRSQVSPFRLSA